MTGHGVSPTQHSVAGVHWELSPAVAFESAIAFDFSQPYDGRMLSQLQRDFLEAGRVAHLATADRRGAPHLIPVCFCLSELSLYITVDAKPKRTDIPLKRIRNIQENPAVAVTVDRWDEDWTRLGWVMLRGVADILADGDEHDRAQALLRLRYAQYRLMDLHALPVIAIRIRGVLSWGALDQRPT